MTPIESVLTRLPSARQNGRGWMACCPAHDDCTPSLNIWEDDDGRVGLKCYAGCPTDAICLSLGIKKSELFLQSTSTESCFPREKQPFRRFDIPKKADQPTVRVFATAEDAVAALEQCMGPRSAIWTYHDATGSPVGKVVRWNRPDGKKEIRPVSLYPDGWRHGGMPELRPLYGLPDLASANLVYVCEGEKAADAVRSLGLIATTSAQGSQSFAKTDWRPLASKEVIILPDNDSPGRKYADAVAEILTGLNPPAAVKLLELPDLPDKGDAADFVTSHGDATPDALCAMLEGWANEAETIEALPPTDVVEAYKPFPVDALPQPLRRFVKAAEKAIGCDPSYVVLPLLTAIAAAIGNTRCLQLKHGWSVLAILWTVIVGESGSTKTPAFKLVMKPIRKFQRRALKRYSQEMAEYEADMVVYGKEFKEWEKSRDGGEPPVMPVEPRATRYIVSDVTVEALAPLLQANPRGLILAVDELSGWFASFDRYAGGRGGGDASRWLSMHNGESIIVDRKTGIPRTIHVDRACMSVCGSIQPGILRRALSNEHRESGMAARLLMACPPRKAKVWSETEIPPALEDEIARLLSRLYDLEPSVDADEDGCPVVVGLTPEAKAAWEAYFNAHGQEQADLTGDLSAAWSKLEEYAARLALVIHFARWAADDPTLTSVDAVDAESMGIGIQLANWFKGEARRVYGMMSEDEESRNRRRIVEWIGRKGGTVTPRDVQQGCAWLKSPGLAEEALQSLVTAGLGRWEQSPAGKRGRPCRRFTLFHVYGNAVCPVENSNIVEVDSVDAPENDTDEWGEV